MPARPDSFFLFLLLIPVLYISIRRYIRGKKDLKAIGGKWRSRLLMDVFFVKWFFSSLLFILFAVSVILALVEFSGSGRKIVEPSSGVDIVFSVDISRSMTASDISPSRLQRSADLISAFIENLPGERFGLSVFKGDGMKVIPITEDSLAVSSVLPYLSPDMFTSSGTNLETGIITGINSFTEGEERKKILIVFTDGESLSGTTFSLSEKIEENDITAIIIGTGTEDGTELMTARGDPVLDKQGKIVVSRLNKLLLQGMAVSDNIYYLDISDSTVLSDALNVIDRQMEPFVVKDQRESRYRIFLSAAILFIILYIVVRIFPWKNTF